MPIARRTLLQCLPLLATPGLAASRTRPNVVVLLADDLGYHDLGCYGGTQIPTPHLDRLAREGMRFTDAHSPSAVCTPTRYGLLTGRYSWRTRLKKGVLYGYDEPLLEEGRLTVPAMLRRHGYRTGCVGKWHLGLEWARKDPAQLPTEENVDFTRPFGRGPLTAGFDRYYGISASLDMPPYAFLENDRVSAAPSAWMERQGIVRAGMRQPDFQTVDVLPRLTSKAVGMVDEFAGKDQPFFLYYPLTSPHTPVVPTSAFRGRSQAGEYGDFVSQTDAAVGEVLACLDRHGLAENTLVIVTSDNGSTIKADEIAGHNPNAPWRGRKSTIWDGGHRVPFLVRWPARVKPGTTSDASICLTDVMATLAGVLDSTLPSNAAEDSASFLPALLGRRHVREAIVHHSIDGTFAVRQWPWKLVVGRGSGGWEGNGSPDDPPGQLYHLERDPEEAKNLYAEQPGVVARLSGALDRFRKTGRSVGVRGASRSGERSL